MSQCALRQAFAPQRAQLTHRHSDSAAAVTSFLQAARRPCGFAVIESAAPRRACEGTRALRSTAGAGRCAGRTPTAAWTRRPQPRPARLTLLFSCPSRRGAHSSEKRGGDALRLVGCAGTWSAGRAGSTAGAKAAGAAKAAV